MDANGVDFAVLSISGPSMQVEPDTAKAVRLARSADELERCRRDRLQGRNGSTMTTNPVS